MLPQKILKIEALKSPEIAFQSNLLGNFFTITLVIFHIKCPIFIVNHFFIYGMDQSLLCHKVG